MKTIIILAAILSSGCVSPTVLKPGESIVYREVHGRVYGFKEKTDNYSTESIKLILKEMHEAASEVELKWEQRKEP